ncbi:MAG: squalene-hopene/tetraprenyl-beta-curcumene cyclase [Gammaproteobacteria bacterium]|nr:squalene-hopene/tetraprenyl-beta-curcumene cyclase [Gammaproteobacteria bacterium]
MNRTSPKPAPRPAELPDARSDIVALTLKRIADSSPLDRAIAEARDALIAQQHEQGYWLYELEADCTIPAEYIMMMHFLDEIDAPLEAKIANHLRSRQAEHGGWPLYHNGELDLSCTIKAYYALKLAGDNPQAPHMSKARAAILERGGAAKANVFTRIALALFGELPWRGVPYIPVEIMLLPKWFPFHIDKVSYWSRTVMVPLFILCTRKPKAKNPRNIGIRELFTTPPEKERHYFKRSGMLAKAFLLFDHVGRMIDPLIPPRMREHATKRAESWVLERLNGEDGLGAIFPAMVNALEAMVILGYPKEHPSRVTAKRALQKLLVVGPSSAYCQPCVSPIWDTALACLAMQEAGDNSSRDASTRALDWLKTKQLLDEPGDWRVRRPDLPGGGWAFQFANDFYPDLDDTAVVAWAMHQARDSVRYDESVRRALDWLVGMQSRDGGFAAFDADNTCYYLNKIPFADHGALLDPPTSDVTARVVTVLARIGRAQDKPALTRAIAYLRKQQEQNGSWFGRWGTNYIYGTWSVLMSLAQAHIGPDDPVVRRAVTWLKNQQNSDGGWGESNDSYALQSRAAEDFGSTPYQTAWALLALMSAGEASSEAVRRGVEYLLHTRQADDLWSHPSYTAPGFPRVFYLRYHGYSAYFPLWALAAYRNLTRRGIAH